MRPFFAISAIILLSAGCAVNPVTGKNEISFVSESQELQLGSEQYLPSQQSQGGLYQVNKPLTDYVTEVGQRVAVVSDRNLPYEFVVLNNGVPNAWALPGGKIAVNRGLLVALDNEAELAAVLGHEVVHAAARHGAKSMERGVLLQGVLLATSIGASNSEYGNYIVGGAQLGTQLLTQKYGRTAELESDYYGIQYMAEAGYDPQAAITLQEKFVKFSEGHEQGWLDGLFASHPPSAERVAKNEATVAALAPNLRADLTLGTARYQSKIAYLKSHQDAYTAFDQANTLASSNELESALAAINRAISREPREPRFYGLKGDIYLEQGDYSQANRYYAEAIKRDEAYYEYHLGRGLAYTRLGNREQARKNLTRSNELLPTAVAMNALGELSLSDGDTQSAKGYFQTAMSAGGTLGQAASIAFTKLDLAENPSKYIGVEPRLLEGELTAIVTNQTPIPVSQVDITFSVTANGDRLQRTISLTELAAGQRLTTGSGFRFSDTDQVESISVTVTRASLQ